MHYFYASLPVFSMTLNRATAQFVQPIDVLPALDTFLDSVTTIPQTQDFSVISSPSLTLITTSSTVIPPPLTSTSSSVIFVTTVTTSAPFNNGTVTTSKTTRIDPTTKTESRTQTGISTATTTPIIAGEAGVFKVSVRCIFHLVEQWHLDIR